MKNEKGEILGGVETFRDHSLVEELRRELVGNFEVGDMVSRSKGMKKIFNILQQVAESGAVALDRCENFLRIVFAIDPDARDTQPNIPVNNPPTKGPADSPM